MDLVRKKVYTKQHILADAQDLLIKKGFSSITARNVAEHMGISTQPIYLEFKDMEDLKITLLKTTHELIEKKYFYENPTMDTVINFGLNYIKFAKEDSALYLSLYVRPHSFGQELQDLSFDLFERVTKDDEKIADLTLEDRKALHMSLWIVATGISSLTASGMMEFSENKIITSLQRVEQSKLG
ncbi:regulatory protein, TetR [Enterococcus sp. 5H]|nr:regulatory protein, TetR [Enterococcus sp. 5H]